MRIVYLDIDCLRPDHMSCYGYHRNTTPNLDRVAAQGLRLDRCYASDTPCLPSRSALIAGRFGIHTGAIGHGGTAADPFVQGPGRRFRSELGNTSWMACLRNAGFKTVTISTFGERHSAFHWYAGFNEVHNVGQGGMEQAHEVVPVALDWLRRNGRADNWFLHLHLWDPHTPYRAPEEFGDPFSSEPLPSWLSEAVRSQHWQGVGPHSAQELRGFGVAEDPNYPRQPVQASSLQEVRRMFDGYDTGVRYADENLGRVLNLLEELDVGNQTAVLISADHGECLGELNVYGDHQTADEITHRVPMILRWPGLTDKFRGQAHRALHYQIDVAATVVELVGRQVPRNWDGSSFAGALREGVDAGRDSLVLSHGAWSCQRAARFEDYICVRSYHDGLHDFPEVMLFNLREDPHEQHDLASKRPDIVARAMNLLDGWYGTMMRSSQNGVDPMWTVLREGGPFHTRGELPNYLERLRKTGRSEAGARLAAAHPNEVDGQA